MAATTASLAEQAESIFTDLGYTVADDGGELRAERKWRVVRVTTVHEDIPDPPTAGPFRCFVTRPEDAERVRNHLYRLSPEYEWAVIGVEECGEYEVHRGDDVPLAV
jgi:hypothetical protein